MPRRKLSALSETSDSSGQCSSSKVSVLEEPPSPAPSSVLEQIPVGTLYLFITSLSLFDYYYEEYCNGWELIQIAG